MIKTPVRPAPARRRADVDPCRRPDDRDRCGVPCRQRQPALLRVDDRGDQSRLRRRVVCRAGAEPSVSRRCVGAGALGGRAGSGRRGGDRAGQESAAQRHDWHQPPPRRHAGFDRARGRGGERRLLGHPREAEHPLPRLVLCEGGARIRRPGHGLDPEHRREDELRLGDRLRPDRDVEAVRTDPPDRQRHADNGGAIRAQRGSARHGVVQSRLAVPANLQESAERLPGRHHADDGRHEAEVPAVPWRQLPRRGPDRRSIRVEEDAGATRGPSGPRRALGVPLVGRVGSARVPAVVRGHGRRAAARGLCRLLAQGSTRQSGTGPRAVRAATHSTKSST